MGGSYTEVPISGVKRVTADRLSESKRMVPHYYLTVDTTMDKLMEVRQKLNANGDVKLSVNDFVVKAVAKGLEEVPALNSHWHDTVIRQYDNIHVGVAVNTDFGLFVPVVRDANFKGLASINEDVRSLAEKARNRKLGIQEMEGGTFTISNLGSFGIKTFSAVINPPQSGILAVGAARDEFGADGSVQKVMSITLSADHRVVDGAIGAQFLQSVKKYLENPLQLML